MIRELFEEQFRSAANAKRAAKMVTGARVLQEVGLRGAFYDNFVSVYLIAHAEMDEVEQRMGDAITKFIKNEAPDAKRLTNPESLAAALLSRWQEVSGEHSAKADANGFCEGMLVDARWLNGDGNISTEADDVEGGCGFFPGWYRGTIIGAGKKPRTYTVKFEDGTTHEFVPPWYMRRPK